MAGNLVTQGSPGNSTRGGHLAQHLGYAHFYSPLGNSHSRPSLLRSSGEGSDGAEGRKEVGSLREAEQRCCQQPKET